jgi:hypothetical protein
MQEACCCVVKTVRGACGRPSLDSTSSRYICVFLLCYFLHSCVSAQNTAVPAALSTSHQGAGCGVPGPTVPISSDRLDSLPMQGNGTDTVTHYEGCSLDRHACKVRHAAAVFRAWSVGIHAPSSRSCDKLRMETGACPSRRTPQSIPAITVA